MSPAHRRAFGTVFAQIGAFLFCFLPFVLFVGMSAIKEDIIPKKLQVFHEAALKIDFHNYSQYFYSQYFYSHKPTGLFQLNWGVYRKLLAQRSTIKLLQYQNSSFVSKSKK